MSIIPEVLSAAFTAEELAKPHRFYRIPYGDFAARHLPMVTTIISQISPSPWNLLILFADAGLQDSDLPLSKCTLEQSVPSIPLPILTQFLHAQTAYLTLPFEVGEHRDLHLSDGEPFIQVHPGAALGGRFGVVSEVKDVHLHNGDSITYARKTLYGLRTGDHREASWRRELRLLSVVDHAHLVRHVASYSHGPDLHLIIAPWAETTLQNFMDTVNDHRWDWWHNLDNEGKKTLLINWLSCLSSALTYLHTTRIKHCNIQPKNILIHTLPTSNLPSPIITDFGFNVQYALISHAGSDVVGTDYYKSPELSAAEQEGADEAGMRRAVDVFAMGCVFLEIFLLMVGTGRARVNKLVKKNGGSYGKCVAALHDLITGEGSYTLSDAVGTGPEIKALLVAMTSIDPESRPTAKKEYAEVKKIAELLGVDSDSMHCGGDIPSPAGPLQVSDSGGDEGEEDEEEEVTPFLLDLTTTDWSLFSRVIRQAVTDRTRRYIDSSRLSSSDRAALAQAEQTQKLTVWEQIAWLHNRFNEQIHANNGFLVWHRNYVNHVERFFQGNYDRGFAFPYWATELEWDPSWWARDSVWDHLGHSTAGQDLTDGPLAGIRFTEQGRGLYRDYTLSDPSVQTATDSDGRKTFAWAALDFYNAALQGAYNDGYRTWATTVERLHGYVHVSQGGLMSTMYSPLDYMFWLHHTNVDRLWHRVQTKWNGENRPQSYQLAGSCPSNPNSNNCLSTSTTMPYFGSKASQIQFIAQQCVQYAPQVNQPFNGHGPTRKRRFLNGEKRKKRQLTTGYDGKPTTNTGGATVGFSLISAVNASLPSIAKSPRTYLTPTYAPPDLPASFVQMFFANNADAVTPELRSFLDQSFEKIKNRQPLEGTSAWETNTYEGSLPAVPVDVFAQCCLVDDLGGGSGSGAGGVIGYCPNDAVGLARSGGAYNPGQETGGGGGGGGSQETGGAGGSQETASGGEMPTSDGGLDVNTGGSNGQPAQGGNSNNGGGTGQNGRPGRPDGSGRNIGP
ncbi:hypothetical protein HDV00_004644 [Rhizophlyctis rosea]|nr:hypothetical protein HDV00_004644 [Rhizophlyctis rosea]